MMLFVLDHGVLLREDLLIHVEERKGVRTVIVRMAMIVRVVSVRMAMLYLAALGNRAPSFFFSKEGEQTQPCHVHRSEQCDEQPNPSGDVGDLDTLYLGEISCERRTKNRLFRVEPRQADSRIHADWETDTCDREPSD